MYEQYSLYSSGHMIGAANGLESAWVSINLNVERLEVVLPLSAHCLAQKIADSNNLVALRMT